jgi:hypothetical protein
MKFGSYEINFSEQRNYFFWVKIFAVFAMVFDHFYLGFAFYKIAPADSPYWMFIGRFAIPIFVIMLAYNYVFNTKNPLIYISRLLLVGVISEIPHYLYFGKHFNFILAMGVALLAHHVLSLYRSQAIEVAASWQRAKVGTLYIFVTIIVLVTAPQAGSIYLLLIPLLALFNYRKTSVFLVLKGKKQCDTGNGVRHDLIVISLVAVTSFMMILFYGGTEFPKTIMAATTLSVLMTMPFFSHQRGSQSNTIGAGCPDLQGAGCPDLQVSWRWLPGLAGKIFSSKQQAFFYLFYPAHLILLYLIFGSIAK